MSEDPGPLCIEVSNGALFRTYVHGTNFMTPRWLGYYRIPGGGEAALATGTGISGQPIFGVTVVRHGAHDHKAERCFHRKADALTYIAHGCKPEEGAP